MNNPILYKDIYFYLEFLIETIHPKLFHLFHIDLEGESDKIYRLSFVINSSKGNSIDIYLNSTDKKLLFGTIYNILHGTTESAELIFSNKLDQHNKGYYKLTQFIDYMEPGINMNLKLKIYKDKNFVIIEPKVLYSYLPLINTELNIDIYPILLSENFIDKIKSKCE